MAPTRFSSGPSLWSLSRYLRWDTRLAYTGMYPIPSVCQHAQPSTPNAEGNLKNQPEISVRRSTAKSADRYIRPGPLDAPRCREPHVVAVVCADVETGASADYKTGENAVILSRR